MADVDGDGLIELVLGLTDRVVRSYRWYGTPPPAKPAPHMPDPNLSQPKKLAGMDLDLQIII